MTKRGKDESLSTFGKSTFERDIMQTTESDVKQILKQIQTIDYEKIRPTHALPGVVDRLLNSEDSRSRARITKVAHQKIRKKSPDIRKVKKVVSPLDNGPSASHYTPNFDSVLTGTPKHRFQKSELDPIKKVSNLENSTMSEMIYQWDKQIRRINFQKPSGSRPESPDLEQLSPSVVLTPQKTYNVKMPGVIAAEANRDSFMKHDNTPGPSDYQKIVSQINIQKVSGFNLQASRPTSTPACTHIIRDVGRNIDAIKPRTAQCIPFSKQCSREPEKKMNDQIWDDIEKEQERIIQELRKDEPIQNKRQKKKQPFQSQTSKPELPFQHLMRDETEPSEALEVERSLKSLDRPITSFDIRAPAEPGDRMVYRKSEAPDVMYDNVNEQYKNTIPRPLSPVPLSRTVTRHAPYYYMPKPCGQGLYNVPVSSFDKKITINFSKMGERQYMLDSPGSIRKKTATGIPPPNDEAAV